MQSSTRIPRRVSGEEDGVLSNTEVKKGKQEDTQKISLTGQGKAAKLLRQRLAFALATNTKLKSDSSNSESDPETTGKGSKTQEGSKTSIPRKISQETARKTPQLQHLLGGRNNDGNNMPDASERSLKFGITQSFSKNSNEDIKQENVSTANLPSQKKPTRLSKFTPDINNEPITNDNTAAPSRDPRNNKESLPDIHEKATKNPEGATSPKHSNLDDIESELLKLKMEIDKTLTDFKGIKVATENVKMKLEELRRNRIRSAS